MPDDVFTGKIEIADYDSARIMILNGATGEIVVGGGFMRPPEGKGPPGHDGSITVKTSNGHDLVAIRQGYVNLYDTADPTYARVMLNALHRYIVLTTEDKAHPGTWSVIRLDGSTGAVSAGGNGLNGELALFPSGIKAIDPAEDKTKATIHLTSKDATVQVGGANVDGRMLVLNKYGTATITLDGSGVGDITLFNADCAEDFDVAASAMVEPGTVMALDHDGNLKESDQPYDRKVAGVISGARECAPGIVLGKKPSSAKRFPLALVGKVYCKVDARYSPVDVGDLLTTSASPGHAMKVTDPIRAFGAVIGKALLPLRAGQDLIPILVALQ